ncbi:polynucleotide adenylyltransferase [Salinicola sp. MH3R3-1]|uniref:polynucleotide adenylyltransferase n=1 Tax=Salinicola sp. MH3R3-1 TaxID=1928762 RepID=UPI00094E4AF8|nr:polynucleotide adenylyltransferase [Salinicola sp. MH3R3-1]OLO06605.1 polynucleotide adenylyltransferase [Salinicola sp. MH3R3-1]
MNTQPDSRLDPRLDGLEVYLVGGAVRDARLGWPVGDRDWVVVGTTPESMRQRGFKSVGRDFPVFLHPDSHEEYALARTERKQGHGYTGFEVHASPDVTLEADLARRDFTINAMAETPDGELIDPYGGAADLAVGQLKHVSAAFVEDPLRVLRAARFLARYRKLGFTIAAETQALMGQLVASGEMRHLVAERVWTETHKALGEADPGAYFETLDDCGALTELMPPLATPALADVIARLGRVPDESTTSQQALWRWARLGEHLEDVEQARLNDAVKAPNAYRDAMRLASLSRRLRRQLDGERPAAESGRAEAIMTWLDAIDAWRRPERVAPLLALIAHDDGELADDLALAWRLAAQILPQALLDDGFRGPELGKELSRRREETVREALEGR